MCECKRIRELPAGIGCCKNLVEINCLKCISLERLPDEVEDLPELEDLVSDLLLWLTGLIQHHSFFFLSTDYCSYPLFVHSFSQILGKCKSITSLPDGLWKLQKLSTLDIHLCPNIKALPEEGLDEKMSSSSSSLPLRSLDCRNCSGLKSLPPQLLQGNLPSLQTDIPHPTPSSHPHATASSEHWFQVSLLFSVFYISSLTSYIYLYNHSRFVQPQHYVSEL